MIAYTETINFLKSKGLNDFGKTIKINNIDKNNDTIAFFITGGFAPESESKLEFLGLQIITSTTSQTEGYQIQDWIYKTLENATQDELNSLTKVEGYRSTSSIIFLNKDENTNKYLFSNNFIIYSNKEV
jgi:hypothetical protein